jgi:polysaccharide export outer membrane protein
MVKLALIILSALIVFSCSSTGTINNKTSTFPPEVTSGLQRGEEISLQPAPAAEVSPHDYVLGPDDVLNIDVFQANDLKRTARIDATGMIKFPPVGRIKVAGLTVSEAEDEISKKLEQYINQPIVSIFIKDYESQKVTILGAVHKPQVYVLTGPTHLLNVLSVAEGLEEDAGNVCYIQRGSETIVINIRDLLYKGDMRLNVPVFSGDVINVARGGIIFVDGAVNGPGAFPIKGTVTLAQAIAMAKGLNYVADKSEIRIYRDTGRETRDYIEVNYNDILDKKIPDVTLQDRDIVVVPQSGVKDFFAKFFQVMRFYVNFGDVTAGTVY